MLCGTLPLQMLTFSLVASQMTSSSLTPLLLLVDSQLVVLVQGTDLIQLLLFVLAILVECGVFVVVLFQYHLVPSQLLLDSIQLHTQVLTVLLLGAKVLLLHTK